MCYKGYKITEEHRRNLVLSHIGKNKGSKNHFYGKTHTKKTRDLIGELSKIRMRGRGNPRWVEDKTKLQFTGDAIKDRRSSRYKYWRTNVLDRDNHTCRLKDKNCSGRIETHHIKSWTYYPKLRFEINNGITLCHAHHPRIKAEEKRLESLFKKLVSVSKVKFVNTPRSNRTKRV